jgi:hypothetical protein
VLYSINKDFEENVNFIDLALKRCYRMRGTPATGVSQDEPQH